ncbi:hypothetical protein JVU11DRAFT_7533 [Chiua virens]|nr:hypothetical protein JVU11DRAFT_7533 [Chiua virens]
MVPRLVLCARRCIPDGSGTYTAVCSTSGTSCLLSTEGNPASGTYYCYDTVAKRLSMHSIARYHLASDNLVHSHVHMFTTRCPGRRDRFENAPSFVVKGSYIKDTELRRFAVWEVRGTTVICFLILLGMWLDFIVK